MCTRQRAAVVVVFSALAVTVQAGEPARTPVKRAPSRAFKLAKKEFQQKAQSKQAADRVAAVDLLAEFPNGESADMVYMGLLGDRVADVRAAAIAYLAGVRDNREVADVLLKKMTAATRKDGMDTRALGALVALGGTDQDDLELRLIAYLNEFLGTPQADQRKLHDAIDERAQKNPDADFMRLLMLFTRTEFFDRHFGFRRCVVQGLTEVKESDAIMHLINLLPRFKGLVQFDVVNHLIASTGQNFGDDAGKWKLWWLEDQGKSIVRDKKVPPVSQYGNFGTYHGIPVCAKRVVFVLDTSGSMRGAKIDIAKDELVRVIRELPQEVSFNIVAFDGNARIWQRELAGATELVKQFAVSFVMDQPLGSNTASYDALEAAFELDPEAIYFLSDGAPAGGKVEDPNQIVAIFSALNRVRRVSIHSIGIDTNLPSAASFGRFMKTLAESNWGIYKPMN